MLRCPHMHVGQDVQVGAIRRQRRSNLFLRTAGLREGRQLHRRPPLRRPGGAMPRVTPLSVTRSPTLAPCLPRRCTASTAASLSATLQGTGTRLFPTQDDDVARAMRLQWYPV